MPIRGRTDDAIIEEARARYLAGEKVTCIAVELGISPATIDRYIIDLPARRPAIERRRRDIVTCLESGLDVRDTATKLGCSIGMVVRTLRAERERVARELGAMPPAPTLDACDSSSSSGTIERKPG